MSFARTRRWAAALVAGVLVCVAGAHAGETEVTGVGFGATGRPPETDNPPSSWTGASNEHDPEMGQAHLGASAYELYQGGALDDRARHKSTDFVRWFVHAATLRARGQAQDADPQAETKVMSEAWGMKRIRVDVAVHEGRYGKIRAKNDISFEYSFHVSGAAIGEAGVRLSGTAFDINAKPHTFVLTASDAEEVASRTKQRRGLALGSSNRAGGGATLDPSGRVGKVDGEMLFEIEASGEFEEETTRRFGVAEPVNGVDHKARVGREVVGPTPLEELFEVFSDGNVELTARTNADGVPVVVSVDRFVVKNLLRCWKSASDAAPPVEPPDTEPPPPPPADPGTPDGPETPGGGGDPEDGCVAIDGVGWISGHPVMPHGLLGEPGALPGTVALRLSADAPYDLTFAVTAEPPDAIDLGADSVRIEAGNRLGGVPFHSRAAEEARIVFSLVDDLGAVLARLEVPVDGASVATHDEAILWTALPGHGRSRGRERGVAGLVGESVGPLRIGRLGFAGFATTATTVAIEVLQDGNVLAPLPLAVTIPAGVDDVQVPLTLGATPGAAVVRLTAGARTVEVHVRSRGRSWSTVPRVYVPLGAVAAVPFTLAHVERTPRVVTATPALPHVADAVEQARVGGLLAGERSWYVPFRGLSPGTTEVVLSSEGLPPLVVPVEVTPAWVSFEPGRLVLSELDGTRTGSIHLSAPADVHFADLDLPSTSIDYLEVEGLGTSQLILRFTPSADLPAALSLPLHLVGPDAPFDVAVYDSVHGDPDAPVRNSYRVTVR